MGTDWKESGQANSMRDLNLASLKKNNNTFECFMVREEMRALTSLYPFV